ncbi:MAG: hypothetical protein GEU76_11775 [Alphaproteobacteria bacterium]|nr:hypothetical protein [Alphaproteobacteria bacterium]
MMILLLNLAALAALLALAAAPFAVGEARDGADRSARFWILLAVALAGTGAVVWVDFAGGWRVGLAPALWLTIVVTLALYGAGSVLYPSVARIGALLAPYLLVLGTLATVWAHAPEPLAPVGAGPAWLGLHIAVSVATYALFTLAAVAGAAVFVQERAMKARRPSRLTALLPAVADGEGVQRVLMTAAAVVLGLGLATGMVIEYGESGQLVAFSHKTVFSLAAFAVIVSLIAVERASGLAGRRAARLVLLAYLFLTLAYPGVKFVTEVVLGRA